MGEERRRFKRLPIALDLEVSSLFNQTEEISLGEVILNVFDISKGGIGFTSYTKLPLGYYFNATIRFEGSDDQMKYVVKIVYTRQIEGGEYVYGCEFVGFTTIYDYLFEKYENLLSEQGLLFDELPEEGVLPNA